MWWFVSLFGGWTVYSRAHAPTRSLALHLRMHARPRPHHQHWRRTTFEQIIEKEDAILTTVGTWEYEELRRELFAYVFDIFAFYYLKRDKSATAIQYAKKALACHRAMGQPHQIAKCKLHIACAQARARDHKSAIKTLGGILKMVDDGRLETSGTSAEKICLVVSE